MAASIRPELAEALNGIRLTTSRRFPLTIQPYGIRCRRRARS